MAQEDRQSSSEGVKAKLAALDKAVHEYLEVRGEIGGGEVLTAWGICASFTKLSSDGEPMFSTSSFQMPGGIATYTWIGILTAERQRWVNYFTSEGDDDG